MIFSNASVALATAHYEGLSPTRKDEASRLSDSSLKRLDLERKAEFDTNFITSALANRGLYKAPKGSDQNCYVAHKRVSKFLSTLKELLFYRHIMVFSTTQLSRLGREAAALRPSEAAVIGRV